MTRAPSVDVGHVAGWVGVGGPGQGADGEDAWIQAGIASMPGMDPVIYAEITQGSGAPEFIPIEQGVAFGRPPQARRPRDVGPAGLVARVGRRPGRDRPRAACTAPRGAGRRSPPPRAGTPGRPTCNEFGFRFERVSVSYGGGGSWRPFVPGHRFLNGGNQLRDLASAPAQTGVYNRTLATRRRAPVRVRRELELGVSHLHGASS